MPLFAKTALLSILGSCCLPTTTATLTSEGTEAASATAQQREREDLAPDLQRRVAVSAYVPTKREEEEIEEVLEGSDADDLMKMLPDLSNLDSLSLDELTQTKEMLLGIEQMLAKQQSEVEQLTRQQETMRSYLATRAE